MHTAAAAAAIAPPPVHTPYPVTVCHRGREPCIFLFLNSRSQCAVYGNAVRSSKLYDSSKPQKNTEHTRTD